MREVGPELVEDEAYGSFDSDDETVGEGLLDAGGAGGVVEIG